MKKFRIHRRQIYCIHWIQVIMHKQKIMMAIIKQKVKQHGQICELGVNNIPPILRQIRLVPLIFTTSITIVYILYLNII